MKYVFHPEALEEYRAAAHGYEKRGKALALRFVSAVEEAIWKIAEAPERWRIVEEDVHRGLTHVFPYGILYTIESDFVLIVAVMHLSREPGYWKHRLTEN
ncbi:MAG TPA: type II toxin-antitoxin system RelE/ParE family toxin [Pyrinomonadaceae bacterium]|nr:type II toxin-antitoxin system RelE/ParE family toxin [Pyrinomonadaceae bacterium]